MKLNKQDMQRPIASYRVSFTAIADETKRLQEKTAAELDALLPSILDRAFKGKLCSCPEYNLLTTQIG